MDSVISTGFSLHVTNPQKRVRSDHTMNSRQSETAARNPCNVEMRMLKGGFEVFSPCPCSRTPSTVTCLRLSVTSTALRASSL